MNWLLLAVLLAVPQAPPPTPGPTPDKTAPTQQGAQAPDNSSTPPATPSQPAPDTSTTKPNENSGATTKPDVSLAPVEISKFPPVSVTKGWTDYTYWGFGLLLVVVGALQVLLLYRTLGAISDQAGTMKVQAQTMKDQAQIMEQQSKATEEAAKAATLNAKAALQNIEMFISKERAHLRVQIDDLKLEPKFANVYAVDLKVFIHGATPAFITDAQCVASWSPPAHVNDTGYVPYMYGMRLPNPIAPNSDPIEDFSIFEDESGEIVKEIKLDRVFVTIWGFIKYKDVFDRDRETRFRRAWKFSDVIPVDAEYRPGKWEKCGTEEDNKET
jgi:hypothetical protein